MGDSYEIMLGDQSIGTAAVMKEGLYYRFRCRCRLSGEIMYQVKVICGEKECSLGVCVPFQNGFGMDTALPIKSVGTGEFSFYAAPRHLNISDKFVPIRADEPFLYLEKLHSAYLDIQNGELGISISES